MYTTLGCDLVTSNELTCLQIIETMCYYNISIMHNNFTYVNINVYVYKTLIKVCSLIENHEVIFQEVLVKNTVDGACCDNRQQYSLAEDVDGACPRNVICELLIPVGNKRTFI